MEKENYTVQVGHEDKDIFTVKMTAEELQGAIKVLQGLHNNNGVPVSITDSLDQDQLSLGFGETEGDDLMALGDGIGRNKGINHWSQSRQNDYYRGAKDVIEWLLSNDKYAACTIDADDNCIICDVGLVEDNYTVSINNLFKEFQKEKQNSKNSFF